MDTVYKLIYHKPAVKFIAKLDMAAQERIAAGLKGLLAAPPAGDIKRLKGNDGLYRLRVGSFRIIFMIDHHEHVIFIQAVGNRGDIYK
ncbi:MULTISPECIES: type II toxin-antitoxin system RelE/ParE family toxin [unclassified Sporosarcina]|uniref:type II toxin-antitoxin system RelE family toxin n=1 Tax=unclassified Sporosarcina TaxID=2647733 RepID=UPI00203D8568|nr:MULTISPECIES: type II toxin-antitoxin system RelE/ParE family toxin [unclassified Sporosarcina]GKV65185.1 plasmid stabilization protein [Sporosarcina sp. NCCP-2331]GLB55309.1 plasmid stabilization protein [Sporosarcina sp. NCCP-2378]